MSQCNELEQALKVADNPALGSTTERILAAEVRRLQAVNQTINAIWEEVDTYARNHSEIQLGESVSQHALELMKDRDALKAELARLREQKPVRWHVRGNYFHDGDAAILFASRNPMCGAKVEQLYAAPVPAVSDKRVDELAMLIRRLVRRLNQELPHNDIGEAAMDYLARNGISGEILRGWAAPAVPYGVDEEAANRIALAVYDCKHGINQEPLLYAINRILVTEAHPLSTEGQRALLQSAPTGEPK